MREDKTRKPTIDELEHLLSGTNADEYETVVRPNGEIETIHHGKIWALENEIDSLREQLSSMADRFDEIRTHLPDKEWAEHILKEAKPRSTPKSSVE